MSNPDLSPDIAEAMTNLGISADSFDDGSLELAPEETPEESAPSEEVATEGEEAVNEDSEASTDAQENNPEGDENQEAPIEEPKSTAKEVQEIAAAREALETERSALTKERQLMEMELQEKYGEKVKVHDELDSFLSNLASKDPDLFGLIKGEFAEFQRTYSNPLIDKFQSEMAEIKKELNQFKSKASDEVTRTKLDGEISKVKSTLGKEAEAAGIKIDYRAVEDVWADNPKLSYEEAVWAKYGQQLSKAMASKAKVASVEKKVQSTPKVSTSGSVKRSNSPVKSDYSGSWDDAVKIAMRAVGIK